MASPPLSQPLRPALGPRQAQRSPRPGAPRQYLKWSAAAAAEGAGGGVFAAVGGGGAAEGGVAGDEGVEVGGVGGHGWDGPWVRFMDVDVLAAARVA